MWEFVNGMADGLRSRMMPRRRNGIGTMTAMLIGASVGIAAWETIRRAPWANRGLSDGAQKMAEEVMESLQE
ncbi:MAG: hypothetical protein IRZ33_00675 [Alicyclobacillaceae bacterium]|nr:hypothetical protein [Alicyclobacillaceae bacterium]